MDEMNKVPRVGVGTIVVKDNKILLGKRKGAHGEGSWCPPGGHLEFNEELEKCARRETFEETGIKIKNVKFGTITNDIFKEEGKHYITIFMISEFDSGEVKLRKPEKCEKWDWFSLSNLPNPLFLPMQNLLKQGFNLLK